MRLFETSVLAPPVLVRGAGCTVWDRDGNSYLDMLAGVWCNILGYGHPVWLAAIRDQIEKVVHVGSAFANIELEGFAEQLAAVVPTQLNRFVLLNTGSEAVELALKLARAATGGERVVVMENGNYGATTYAFHLSRAGSNVRYLPAIAGTVRLSMPCETSTPTERHRCLDTLSEVAGDRKSPIAAIVYEPVMGSGGVRIPPTEYGRALRRAADKCGALLVAEEVSCGMGRTGKWWGCEHDGIIPDILVLGKALGSGLPVAAVVTTEDVERRCKGILRHVQSHQNDPFSARLGATVISIVRDEQLVRISDERGRQLLDGLRSIQSEHPCIREVRGRGTMVGVELHAECISSGPAVLEAMRRAGVILDFAPHAGTFLLLPPYVITREEIGSFLERFSAALVDLRLDERVASSRRSSLGS